MQDRQDQSRKEGKAAYNTGFESAADMDIRSVGDDHVRIDQDDYPMVVYDDEQVRALIERLEEVLDDEQ